MMDFKFVIEVENCWDCPHARHMPYGVDCRYNDGEWAFPMVKKGKGGISPNCPFRPGGKYATEG